MANGDCLKKEIVSFKHKTITAMGTFGKCSVKISGDRLNGYLGNIRVYCATEPKYPKRYSGLWFKNAKFKRLEIQKSS